MSAPALAADGLSKRFGPTWALRDCTFEIPVGQVCALVGPNGAGKSTLLQLASGLLRPTAGSVRALGAVPRQDPAWLAEVGYLAQEAPLYRRLSTDQLLGMGRRLNVRWDDALARHRLRELGIDFDQPVGKLSGGERAQVALALALGKRPRLLLLDEPVASLDPLARIDFLSALAEATAESELTVVLSSHLVADIERVCDRLLILSQSRVALAGELPDLLAEHRIVTGPRDPPHALASTFDIVHERHTERQSTFVVRGRGPVLDPRWEVSDMGAEEVVLAYLRRSATATARHHEPVRLIEAAQ